MAGHDAKAYSAAARRIASEASSVVASARERIRQTEEICNRSVAKMSACEAIILKMPTEHLRAGVAILARALTRPYADAMLAVRLESAAYSIDAEIDRRNGVAAQGDDRRNDRHRSGEES
jgi:hypothetical protein